jgi:pimeloyl-ACP methyl ester carboxylesterase
MQFTRNSGLPARVAAMRAALMTSLFLSLAVAAFAQAPKDPPKDPPKGPPDPEDVSFTTRDGVLIKGTYWEPEEPEKDTVPVILLHGYGGKRQEFDALGKLLQSDGHAVLSIDLRGHGGSTTKKAPLKEADDVLDPKKFGKADYVNMVLDVRAAKNFLTDKHKEGQLNIEKLCIVGAEMGAIVAQYFALDDLSRPVVPNVLFKDGQDVRGLVLLSPPRQHGGLTSAAVMKSPAVRGSFVSKMIIVGKNDPGLDDANKLHSSVQKYHAKVPEGADPDDRAARLDLFFQTPDTSLQGTKLLAKGLNVDKMIRQFIDLRLVKKSAEIPWRARESR